MFLKLAARIVKGVIRRVLAEYSDEIVSWLTNNLDIPGKSEDEERRIWRNVYGKLDKLVDFLLDLAVNRLKKRRR